MKLVCIDFLCLELDLSGQGNVLEVNDHIIWYTQAFLAKDQQAVTVPMVQVEMFLCRTVCQSEYTQTKEETLKVNVFRDYVSAGYPEV